MRNENHINAGSRRFTDLFLSNQATAVKRPFRMLVWFTLLFAFLAPSAFAKIRVGVDAGVNVNQLKFSKELFSSSNRVGFFVGPKLYGVIPGLGLGADVAVLYSRLPVELTEQTLVYGSVTDTHNLNYLELPVNLRWNIGGPTLGIYLASGPQFDWFIGDRSFKNIYTNRATVFEDYVFSWNFGAGVMLGRRVQLGVTYNFPVTNAGTVLERIQQTATADNLKNHTWKVRINYFF